MKVYFIGAGPGDPELLTLKAKRIIESADIVIYAGSLVNKEILKFARVEASLYDSSGMKLEEIFEVFREAKQRDRVVARIHSGDLSIYSALQEQVDGCKKEGIETEVIPGISSFQAAAASLKQELTLPGVSQTLILSRLSGRTAVPDQEDLEKLAAVRATLVLFLSVHEIGKVAQKLRRAYPADTPVVVLEKASWPEERTIAGTLENIARKMEKTGIKRQALIIVGDVLRKNYERSKLYAAGFEHGFREKKRP